LDFKRLEKNKERGTTFALITFAMITDKPKTIKPKEKGVRNNV
jgi:hypothetical protein